MDQTQLIELIKTLTPTEKAQILPFATTPFFNNGRMRAYVGPLVALCMEHPWHEPEQRLEKMDIYATLFPEQAFVEGKLEKVMVEALKFIRSVLLTLNYFREDNSFHQNLDYTEMLRLRGLAARYQLSMARLKKMQEDDPWKNGQHFQRQFQLETAIHAQECLDNQRKGDLNIPNVVFATEIYYHLRRFALLNRYLLQLILTKLDVPDIIKRQLEDTEVPKMFLQASPALRINVEIFIVLRKGLPEASDVQLIFDLLRLHEKDLDGESLQEFYAYLRNFSVFILNANREKEEICYTLHELFIDNLARGYLHYEGKISPSRYLAIAENALKINQVDWADEFIEKNKHHIYGENESQDIYHFVKARYLFAIGRFTECLDLIPAISPIVDYFLLGKRLEIKALFEIESDLLSYKLDAFKMFLNRTSQKLLSDTERQVHVDFVNLLTQIIASTPGDIKRAERVIRRVTDNKKTAEWRWLLTKANALRGTAR